MPEFILDHGNPEASRIFGKLDSFTQGYIEAMFFTCSGTSDDDDLEHATVAELSPDAWVIIRNDCAAFQAMNVLPLMAAYGLLTNGRHKSLYESEQAGRDFWFTRNGHGVGFWDRGLGSVGDELSERCGFRTVFDEVSLYRGDDGLLYVGPG